MLYRTVSTWRMYLVSLLLLAAGALLAYTGANSGFVVVAATAAIAALSLLLACSDAAPGLAPGRVRTAIRDRERRTAFLPQRDPDAAGRPRPRAPGHPPRTTTRVPRIRIPAAVS